MSSQSVKQGLGGPELVGGCLSAVPGGTRPRVMEPVGFHEENTRAGCGCDARSWRGPAGLPGRGCLSLGSLPPTPEPKQLLEST